MKTIILSIAQYSTHSLWLFCEFLLHKYNYFRGTEYMELIDV